MESVSQEEKDLIRKMSNEQQITLQNESAKLSKSDSRRNELYKAALALKKGSETDTSISTEDKKILT